MEQAPRGIRWETPERLHAPLTTEKEIALWVVTVGAIAAAIIFQNYILAVLIFVGVFVMSLSARLESKIISCEVTSRGITINSVLFPYEELKTFVIDEQTVSGHPKLILHSKKKFMPYVFVNLPDIDIDTVRHTINYFLAEDRAMKEPMSYKLLEYFGF